MRTEDIKELDGKPIEEPDNKPEDEFNEGEEEVVEGEEYDEDDDDDDDDLVEVGNRKMSKDDLVKSYLNSEKQMNKSAQEAAQVKRQMQELIAQMSKPKAEIAPEDKAALDKLRSLGIPTMAEMKELITNTIATQTVVSERQRVQEQYGVDDAMMNAAYSYSVTANISLEDAVKRLAQPKKVVKKKSLGLGKGKSTLATTKNKGELTMESAVEKLRELKKKGLNDEKDKKLFDIIRTKMEQGELK